MTKSNQSPIKAIIRGTCNNQTQIGTWSAIIEDDTKYLEIANRHRQTTNIEMELVASLKVLQSLEKYSGRSISIVTTSDYLINGVTEWFTKWQSKGWRNASNKPVTHKDKWQELKKLSDKLNIQWCKLSKDEETKAQYNLICISDEALNSGHAKNIIQKQ
ncbi:RNase H family protein [Marinomonas profundimaris]|uniref:Ribonuclease H n=1 Tax=Marinomonas profundimaris TaxID=1208321 RepID=W1RWS1_9GAMM|nr:RNase H family protein [Marinomonas profundimaris]ETI61255.1 ribonuclease H [Marinomonas profundimaris]